MIQRRDVLKAVAGLAVGVEACRASNDTLPAAIEDAIGAEAVRTLSIAGSGATFAVGQNFTPERAWPRIAMPLYKALFDYSAGTMRIETMRKSGERMPPGGGVPFTGELPQIHAFGTGVAWNDPVPVPAPGGAGPAEPTTLPEAGSTPWAGPNGSPRPIAAPESRAEDTLFLWSTPHGFLKAARNTRAIAGRARGGRKTSFRLEGRPVEGFLDHSGRVVRVCSRVEQSLVGDMLIETEYRDYRRFGTVQFPTLILQKQDGFPSLELHVSSVIVNRPANIVAPQSIRQNPLGRPIVAEAQRVGDGVWWIIGGTHHSVAVEMKDHIVLVDTPNGETRATAVIDKAKEIIPGKPIRFVIAMHHHWDHLGGIRTAIAERATIVTHASNRIFLERVSRANHTLKPDRLSASNARLMLQTIDDHGNLGDGEREIQLHTMTHFDHCADMLLVYLPREKMLVEADAFTPPRMPDMPLIAPEARYVRSLYENVSRLGLDVKTIVPLHGMRTAEWAEVARRAQT